MKNEQIKRLALSAMFLALGLALPFLTGQIPQIGAMLSPMHLPALLCGFVCGWKWGLLVGFVMPLLRSFIFGMPPLVPAALCMAFELAAYGAVAGALYARLGDKPWRVIVSLVAAMLAGRAVWGAVSFVVYPLLTPNAFSFAMLWTKGFAEAWPGILLQLILVPLIVMRLEHARLLPLTAEKA